MSITPGAVIGSARCSTDEQDVIAQRDRLAELDVAAERAYLDHGLTGTPEPGRARIECSPPSATATR